MKNLLITVDVLAKILNVTPSYIYTLIRQKKISKSSDDPITINRNNILAYYQQKLPSVFLLSWKEVGDDQR